MRRALVLIVLLAGCSDPEPFPSGSTAMLYSTRHDWVLISGEQVPVGTHVTVLDKPKPGRYRVKVNDGPFSGRVGLAYADDLRN